MKRHTFWIIMLLLLCGAYSNVKAQGVVTGITICAYDIPSNVVNGYSETVNDYTASLYYGVYTEGRLYRNLSLIDGRAAGPAGRQAIVYTQDPNAAQNTQYDLVTSHFIVCVYYTYSGGQLFGYDYMGYSFLPFSEIPGSNNFLANGPSTYIANTVYEHIGNTRVTVGYFPARLDTISPNWGYERGTVDVTLSGVNLDAGSFNTPVRVNVTGGVTATVQSVNSTTLTARFQVPDNVTGEKQVSITTSHNTSNQLNFFAVDRQPQITSISPEDLNAGTTTSVTINGTDFGSAPTIEISGGDIQYSISSRSDTRIVATVSVADTALEGERYITVISNGANGTGFLPGPPQTSPRSNQAPVRVRAPRVNIEGVLAVPKNGTRNVTVTVEQQSTPPVEITLRLRRDEGTGQATFANGTDTMAINQTTNVELKGVTESSTRDNIRLEAYFGDRRLDSEEFSVLWVTLEFRYGNNLTVSPQNGKRQQIIAAQGSDRLGTYLSTGTTRVNGNSYGNAIEIVGHVFPSNFSNPVRLVRWIIAERVFYDMSGPSPHDKDEVKDYQVDEPHLRDETVNDGMVFDFDAPGLNPVNVVPIGRPHRQRVNFAVWAVFLDPIAGGTRELKASDNLFWSSALSARDSNGQQVLVALPDPDGVEGDNRAGLGDINLTWNLRP